MNFTKTQLEAIGHAHGHLQLIACAGSGKTEVVARRVATLLKAGATPSQIVAFTFTDKAAAELKERIVTRCREDLGELPGVAEMYVGTIHAFCLDLLRSEIPRFMHYEVLNEVQQALLIDRNSRKSGLTATRDLAGRPLRKFIDTNNFVKALGILREAQLDATALRGVSILDGLKSYRELLTAKSYFDYSSILEEAVKALVSNADLRGRLGARLKHVIVDEYQDMNPIQECIVRALHGLGADVCVVGDDDQTIYQWRGSDLGNILSFSTRYAGATQVRLEENFRSSIGIVETARDFIAQNRRRLQKAMIPAGAQPYEAGDIVALSFPDPDAEARYLVEAMQALRGTAIRDGDAERGLAWSDMAVLLRSVRANGGAITNALSAAGIPYVVAGMNRLFATPEAEAARQLFQFMNGSLDEATLRTTWLGAGLGIAPDRLDAAIASSSQAHKALQDADEQRWSLYNLQRHFLSFIEAIGLREELVPNGRGEVVFYNLGKFSQVISDFEAIHFHSNPKQKYQDFAGFLEHRAEDAYPEGWQDNAYANPDAVRVMTIHQAKGMQWPAVFVPALLRNRFPSRRPGGRSVWDLLPRAGVVDQPRYEGTIEDERRLFYVAVTRAQKFLHLTWAPIPGNQQAARASEFWDNVLVSKWVKRRRADYSTRSKLAPAPKASVANVVFTFSDLKYFFECPYQFKLRILYGFNAPIHEALGYGKSLHDALAEVHKNAIEGRLATTSDVPGLVATHLHAPYAYPALKAQLEASAKKVLTKYIQDNKAHFDKIEFSEKGIEINLGGGVSVAGRIDLVRRIDTGETTIVDLKSSERAQAEDVTETQLHIYALGYQELTGRPADFVEIYELDQGKRKPRSVDESFIADVKQQVHSAAVALRLGVLKPNPDARKCQSCDYCRMCTAGAGHAKARDARV